MAFFCACPNGAEAVNHKIAEPTRTIFILAIASCKTSLHLMCLLLDARQQEILNIKGRRTLRISAALRQNGLEENGNGNVPRVRKRSGYRRRRSGRRRSCLVP